MSETENHCARQHKPAKAKRPDPVAAGTVAAEATAAGTEPAHDEQESEVGDKQRGEAVTATQIAKPGGVMSENKKVAIGLLVLLIAFGVVGRMDYEDEVLREQEAKLFTRALANCQNQSMIYARK